MMKKTLSLIAITVLALALTACTFVNPWQPMPDGGETTTTTVPADDGGNDDAGSTDDDIDGGNDDAGDTGDTDETDAPAATTKKPATTKAPATTKKPAADNAPTPQTTKKPATSTTKKPATTAASKFTTVNVPALPQKTLTVPALPQSSKSLTAATIKTMSGTVTSGQKSYTYTPARDGYYYFWFTGVKSGVNLNMTLQDSLGEDINRGVAMENNDGFGARLEKGKSYKIVIKPYSSNPSGAYTLNIGEQTATTDISAYSKISDSTVFKKQENNYTFTPERDGYYWFYFTGVKSSVNLNMTLRDSLGEDVNRGVAMENNDGFGARLSKNETYTIVVTPYSDTVGGAYTLNIGKQKATQVVSTYSAVKDSTEFVNQKNLYTFVAAQSGSYYFSFSNVKSGVYLNMTLQNSLEEDVDRGVAMDNNDGFDVILEAGETYTIVVTPYSDNVGGAYTLNIGHKKKDVEIRSNTIINDKIEYKTQANDYNLTVSKAGTHTVTVSGLASNINLEVYVYNELDETVAYDNYMKNGDKLTLKDLKVGEVYEIQVAYKDGLSAYKLTVEK